MYVISFGPSVTLSNQYKDVISTVSNVIGLKFSSFIDHVLENFTEARLPCPPRQLLPEDSS